MSKNPAQAIREAAGQTVRGFAEEANVAVSVVQELELGTYSRISPYLNKSIGRLAFDTGVDYVSIMAPHPTLNEAYWAWQKAQRAELRREIDGNFPSIGSTVSMSPFKALRTWIASSPELKTFCAVLCVPRETVRRYEDGTTKVMPKTVQSALREIGYPWVEELEQAQQEWRRP